MIHEVTDKPLGAYIYGFWQQWVWMTGHVHRMLTERSCSKITKVPWNYDNNKILHIVWCKPWRNRFTVRCSLIAEMVQRFWLTYGSYRLGRQYGKGNLMYWISTNLANDWQNNDLLALCHFGCHVSRVSRNTETIK